MRVRADAGLGAADAVCPFDLAIGLGISVRLVPVPSLEGMYAPGARPTVLVSAERPAARRRYTCAHEIGHHAFGHGACLDEIGDEQSTAWTPEEYLAHRFAAALLMPKLAVLSAFARREWSMAELCPERVFVVAQDLGVGYTTLIGHLERTLRCVPSPVAARLRKAALPKVRSQLAGFLIEHDLIAVDEHWGHRPVDAEVGDVIMVPADAGLDGCCAQVRHAAKPHIVATEPGTGCLALRTPPRLIPIRVERRGFTGLAKYRYLEDAPDVV